VRFGDFLAGQSLAQRPVPQGPLPGPTRDLDQARADLEAYGYALVQDALSPEEVRALRERAIAQAEGERQAGCASIGESSQRIWNPINKGRVFHDLLLNPLVSTIVPEWLGEHFLLQGMVVSIALPGNASSIMHYDQICVQPAVPFAMGLNILWFLEDVTAANGGTIIMPASHHGEVAPADPFDTEGTVAAAGPSGTALILDSRTWHAIGHNTSGAPRYVIATYFNRSYMRTQENYALSLRPEVEAGLDERVRIMLGFRCTGSLGGVEGPMEGKMVARPEHPVGELSPRAEA
jgi:ectoine hydroxylase-related dioxygenase (phytanoyl-CoA dioxygenase family)